MIVRATSFLGAFTQLRYVTFSFVISVCPFVRLSGPWNNCAPTGRIFMKFDIREFHENLSRKFKSHENLTRITCTLHKDQYTFMIYLAEYFYIMRNFERKVVAKIKTHSVFSKLFSYIVPFIRLKLNSVALVRERTMPTERPPPVGEVSANFCG